MYDGVVPSFFIHTPLLTVNVILPLALPGTLTYELPALLAPQVSIGSLVVVPIKRKQYTAIVVCIEQASDTPATPLKPVVAVVEQTPLVLPEQLELWRWMAYYYMCTAGEIAKAALPAGFKDEEKMSRRAEKVQKAEDTEHFADELFPEITALPQQLHHALDAQQERAADEIRTSWHKHPEMPVLLHGVTSSGKTEVYVQLIEETLARGQQVLFLVPEIALTTQLTTRLGRVFGNKMGIYHSKFTDKRRMDLWRKQLTNNAYPMVLGVRSSVFLPWKNLGLVIVDEEHEQSYKQQDPAPRYNARDVAVMLSHLAQKNKGKDACRVLLGSATPSLESYSNAEAGKYTLVQMKERHGGVQMPEIVVEDMKELKRKKLLHSPFSPRLTDLTRDALKNGEQAIFFQNRRGYSPILECRTCGWTPRCTRCDVALTFHQRAAQAKVTDGGTLQCHYCGAYYDVAPKCPCCESTDLRDVGYGTEKIESAVKSVFPEARVQRMDLDTTRSKRSYADIINDFQAGKKNLLVGTQMVTKGLDFDHVHVVGILHADQLLNKPNFRAYEHAYQMLSQVAGRAGRRSGRGIVVLQTHQPTLPVVKHIVEQDYEAMYRTQMHERNNYRFPPAVRLIYIYLKHPKSPVVDIAARVMGDMLRPHFMTTDGQCDLLGPERPAIARVSLQYIRQMIVKVPPERSAKEVRNLLRGARQYILQQESLKSVNIYFDVDPM